MEKQLNPDAYENRHRNSLVDKLGLVDTKDYKMKVFDCNKATKKMYEEYYKTHKYE